MHYLMYVNKVCFIIFFISLSFLCYAENDILDKIKEIDEVYEQGIVSYSLDSNAFGKKNNAKYLLVYNNEKKFKKEDIKDGIKTNWYFDGKDYFEHEAFSKKNILIIRNKADAEPNDFSWNQLTTFPNFRYGRGISRLENATIKDNVVTGKLKGSDRIIKAYIDPQYDYLAYKIECYGPKGNLTGTITNKNPKLIDGKYYIYINSFCSVVTYDKNTKFEDRINIDEATFIMPSETDYSFDWTNDDIEIHDERNPLAPVRLKRSELPENIDPTIILEITKPKAEEQLKIRANSEPSVDKSSHLSIFIVTIVSIIVLVFFMIIFLKKILSTND